MPRDKFFKANEQRGKKKLLQYNKRWVKIVFKPLNFKLSNFILPNW